MSFENDSTILWADDDPDDLLLMKEILFKNSKKHLIKEVNNGREALEYLDHAQQKKKLPCLIILDINMPILDGKETLARIKSNENFSNIPVVVFTTSNSELDRMFCEKYKVEMITKPPDYKTLESAVNRLLGYC